jgi:hypothetical protein
MTTSNQARINLGDFVRRKALEAAEMDMLERPIVTISGRDWEASRRGPIVRLKKFRHSKR